MSNLLFKSLNFINYTFSKNNFFLKKKKIVIVSIATLARKALSTERL